MSMLVMMKAQVAGHYRTLPDGRRVYVRGYRTRAPGAQPSLALPPHRPPPPPDERAHLDVAPGLAARVPGLAAAAQALADGLMPGYRIRLETMPEGMSETGLFLAPQHPELTYGSTWHVPPAHGAGPDFVLRIATEKGGAARSTSDIVWTALHEFGHAFQMARFHAAPADVRVAIAEQWLAETHRKKPLESAEARAWARRWVMPGSPQKTYLESLPLTGGRNMVRRAVSQQLAQSGGEPYYHQFEEWFAEAFATWVSQDAAPRSAVERFFSEAFEVLRRAFSAALTLLGQPTPPPGAMERFASSTWHGDRAPLRKALRRLRVRLRDPDQAAGSRPRPDRPASARPSTGEGRTLPPAP